MCIYTVEFVEEPDLRTRVVEVRADGLAEKDDVYIRTFLGFRINETLYRNCRRKRCGKIRRVSKAP